MTWREVARAVREAEDAGHNRNDRHDSAPEPPIVSIVPNVPSNPARDLREWRNGLAGLAYDKPPSGFTSMRWGQLLDDAEFIFNGFGEQLASEGWSALDVFGVLPWREGGGVLLDRLQGARNLKLDREGRAFWSSFGVTFQTCRSAADTLVSSGLCLVWELK